MVEMVPRDARVNIGDSTMLRQIGVIGELERKLGEVVSPFVRKLIGGYRSTLFGILF